MKQSLFAAEKRSLEGVPQRQLHAAGIAGKNLVPFLEPGIAWDQVVTSVGVLVVVPDRVDIAGHILRVVEDIAKVSAKLDLLIFSANIEDLRERHIEIIGWIRRQSISTTGGKAPRPALMYIARGSVARYATVAPALLVNGLISLPFFGSPAGLTTFRSPAASPFKLLSKPLVAVANSGDSYV